MPPGKEFSGFLSSYDKLKPNPAMDDTLTYVNPDDAKNIHEYIAIMVDPVEVYVATNADVSKIPDKGRTAAIEYYQNAIKRAVSDAFPIATMPGPLVLRLRSALIGVDAGADAAQDKADSNAPRPLKIDKVGVEMELVDSETGEQIAAAVDRKKLGEGADSGMPSYLRAFDGWAGRLRAFLDSAHELTPEQAARADSSYHPYGAAADTKTAATK
jgi:hypothetical protein